MGCNRNSSTMKTLWSIFVFELDISDESCRLRNVLEATFVSLKLNTASTIRGEGRYVG